VNGAPSSWHCVGVAASSVVNVNAALVDTILAAGVLVSASAGAVRSTTTVLALLCALSLPPPRVAVEVIASVPSPRPLTLNVALPLAQTTGPATAFAPSYNSMLSPSVHAFWNASGSALVMPSLLDTPLSLAALSTGCAGLPGVPICQVKCSVLTA